MTDDELVAYAVLGVLGFFLITGLWFVVIRGLVA
jgi:hypothetical protein